MIEKESLTHRIEDDMERRNRNWDIIKTHIRNYTEQVGNPANLTTVSKEVVGAVNELKDEIDTNKEELTQHKQDYMPHRFQDIKNNKIYNFGFQLSAEGNPQMIYEEVIE